MNAYPREGIGNAHRGIYQNTDQDHNKQETGPAARMKPGFRPNIFNRKRFAMFITENGLMLGSVIGKKPFDVFHMGNKPHVHQQNNHLQQAFRKIA